MSAGSEKMKILIVTDVFPPENKGGAGKVAASLAWAYQQLGHDIYVITTTQQRSRVGWEEVDGITVYRIYSNYPERWRAYLGLWNPITLRHFGRLISHVSPDIVHVHNIHYHLSYHCLSFFERSVPLVMTFHDAMAVDYGKFIQGVSFHDPGGLECPKMDYRVRPWKTIATYRSRYFPFRNFIIRQYIHRFTHARIAVSEELRRLLEKNGIRGVQVIYNGVDPDAWEVDSGQVRDFRHRFGLEGYKVILFGGRLSFWKGGDYIIKSLPFIIRKVPNVKLLVLGSHNAYIRHLQNLAETLGVSEHVIFAGWLSGNLLTAAYWSSDVVVVPSIYLDPFPTVVLEGMAARRPIVVSCFSGAKEAIVNGKTGYIVNPLDIRALAWRVAELLQDTSKARKMGEAGYQRLLDRFTLQRSAQEYLKLFVRLLKGRGKDYV